MSIDIPRKYPLLFWFCRISEIWYNQNMKWFILFLMLMSISPISSAASWGRSISLKPSLTIQMQKNEVQLKEVIKIEKAQANRTRLEQNQRNRITRTQKSSSMSSPRSPSTQIIASQQSSQIQPVSVIVDSIQSDIENVDMDRVRATWLNWYNTTRSSLSLENYSYDVRLDQTASNWNSIFAAGKWQNHHTRTAWDGYYNYSTIDEWFQIGGVDPIVTHGVKHSENVGYGSYRCNQSDCTDELIESIRTTYRFFINSRTHYPSIVQPYFTKIGMNIITVPSEGRYYLTVHYITK